MIVNAVFGRNRFKQLIVTLDSTFIGYQSDDGAVKLKFTRLPEHADKSLTLRLLADDGTSWDEQLGAGDEYDVTSLLTNYYSVELQCSFRDSGTYVAHAGTKRLIFDASLSSGLEGWIGLEDVDGAEQSL